MKKLLLRLLLIPIPAYFLALVLEYIYPFFRIQIYLLEFEPEISHEIHNYLMASMDIFVFGWAIVLFIWEVFVYFSKFSSSSRSLRNLRYAPIAVFFMVFFTLPIFDLAAIEHSKYQIRSYVFSNSTTIKNPEISLHNNYRHWCGNGVIGSLNSLYFETASEGYVDKNPYVRARALLISSEVNNALNGGDDRFKEFLGASCEDKDKIVRNTANKYLFQFDSNCIIYLIDPNETNHLSIF